MQYYRLKELLDNLYISYKHKFSSKDPVWNLHRFSDEKDIELVGLITAAYAYGSVDQINRFIETFLQKISFKPHEFIINFSKHKDKKFLEGLYYRFYTDDDLMKLITSLHYVLTENGSLQNLFVKGYDNNDGNILAALEKFASAFLAPNEFSPFPTLERGYGLRLHGVEDSWRGEETNHRYYHYMISSPAGGSTCKRMNLFLRWMIRKDEIDLGIWDTVSTSKLIMPVDTHIARVSKKLRLVKRKTIDLKFAVELTEMLRTFDPQDPVKYDFSLCHIGIDKKDHALIP